MATLVMIYGESGTGKSTSLRNFGENDVAVINVSRKPLPFRSKLKVYPTDAYQLIENALPKMSEYGSIVIDDATYLLVNEFMRNAKVQGYQKFTDIAYNFNHLIEACASLPDYNVVYFLGHSERTDDGHEKFKTIGRLLDEKVTVEGKFTIVLKTVVKDGQYYFQTHNNGQDTVKSPMDMFKDDLIPNDLVAVDDAIREYWGIENPRKATKKDKKEDKENKQ